jgi:hypothetical protein
MFKALGRCPSANSAGVRTSIITTPDWFAASMNPAAFFFSTLELADEHEVISKAAEIKLTITPKGLFIYLSFIPMQKILAYP